MTYYAFADFAPALRGADYVNALKAEQIESAVNARLEEIAGYVRGVEARARVPVPRPSNASSGVQNRVAGGGGSITQEQFAALNQCEASGGNGWRTGRYGLETGTGDVGSWSLERQQAEVQRIYNASGASAWGVACRGILGG